MKKQDEVILAIDVGSTMLETYISNGQTVLLRKTFSNNKRGCSEIFDIAQKHDVKRCVLEATGGYEQTIAGYFYGSGITVNILNPARVRRYAQGIGILAKTDKIDAYVIERYAREVKPKANFKPVKSQLLLKRLITRRSSLKNMIVAEKSRKLIADKMISRSIDRVIKLLEKEVEKLETSIDKLLREDAQLQRKVDVLTEQKGIAKITACSLIGLMPELGYLNKRQVASLAGLAPFNRDSGKMKGKRFIQAGRFLVRKSLYMPAWVAVLYDQKFKQIYNRLTEKGKPPKVAIVAIMRKMIIQANKNMKIYYENNL